MIIEAHDLFKEFSNGARPIRAVNGVSLDVKKGDRMAIVGASGSGKTTLLHLIAGLERPTSGEVRIAGQAINGLSESKRGDIRNQHLGFIFQFHHLLPELSALENVAMPLLIRRHDKREAYEMARHWLDAVGLAPRADHRPAQLSGGERQRAAIARAVVTQPACLLADEPTGNLDYANAERIFDLLLKLNQDNGMAIVVVTHDIVLAERLGRAVEMRDGVII